MVNKRNYPIIAELFQVSFCLFKKTLFNHLPRSTAVKPMPGLPSPLEVYGIGYWRWDGGK